MTNVSTLVTKISRRREMLDQTFYEDLRKLRRLHDDRAVDRRWPGCATPSPSHRESRNAGRSFDVDSVRVLRSRLRVLRVEAIDTG